MGLEIQLVIMVICGAIAAAIASGKGRSGIGWFFGGAFLGLIGIIIVAVLPNKKEEQQRRVFEERERRRLREQVRQERLKNDAFRRYAAARLDSHDKVLGVDTRQPQALLEAPAAGQLADPGDPPEPGLGHLQATPPPVGAVPSSAEVQWFYEINGQTVGPVRENEIEMLLRRGGLQINSLLWSEGLAEWTPVGRIPRFRAAADS